MARRKFSFDARRWDGREFMRDVSMNALGDLDEEELRELVAQKIDDDPEFEREVQEYTKTAADRRYSRDRRHIRDRRPGRDQGQQVGPSSELEGLPPSMQREHQQFMADYHARGRDRADDAHRKIEEDLVRHWGSGRDAVPHRARDRANDVHHKIEQDYRSQHGAHDAAPRPDWAERFPEAARVGVNNLF